MTEFGPTYPHIDSCFKRNAQRNNTIIPWDWTSDEFRYLADTNWTWTEKVDGTNTRLYWDGNTVTLGGRTDKAQMPNKLVDSLQPLVHAIDVWADLFGFGSESATIFGEGYGAGIQRGGSYRPDQGFIVFDVKIGRTWLRRPDVESIANALGLLVVPVVGVMTLREAIILVQLGSLVSAWPGVTAEGLVGKPEVELLDRRSRRIIAKVKTKDFADLVRMDEGRAINNAAGRGCYPLITTAPSRLDLVAA